MAERERLGKTSARTLNATSLKVGGVAVPPAVGGIATITGSGTVTAALNSITAVTATLGANAALAGTYVTASFSGLTITLKVWKPTATGDCTPIASTAALAVQWIAIGS